MLRQKYAALAAASSFALMGRMSPAERQAGRYLRAPDEHTTVKELALQMKADQQKAVDAVKAIAEDALGRAKSGEALTASIKEKADDALSKMNELTAQFSEMEQKLARADLGNREDERKSLGQRFIETEELKSLSSSPRGGASASMSIKADITSATTDTAGAVGAAVAPNRLAGVQELPQRRFTVRNLLTPGTTDSPLIQYIQETGFTNGAAMVAEGALKPQSDLKLTDKDISTKVIAHWFRTAKQILSDFPQIRSMIDGRLLYGLALREEAQLLYGDGTGENLHGIVPQASAFAIPAGYVAPTTITPIDNLRIAMLQAVLAEYPATGHVLNDIDWANIETLKDGEGRYIIGNPQGTLSPTLWSLPVVTTQSMAVGKFLTGAFRMGAQIFDQWASRIEVGFQNDDFTRNKVTILGEERLALAVYRPEAFVYGDINPAP
ncbi:phage major capsid protein [Agrobacterium vitis]|uniref:phage major capsid protein n=1 Tax=Agrobacterium vitis TaxID=373 RepID=UPI0012E6F51C|nr:phage major capsid protein [Agrobacterium vitis]MVB04171.1 phage major capsid protein [Agrobacterium vitis]